MATVSQLAREIWRDHYIPIIGAGQVEYMLERFQSIDAIQSQLAVGYVYFLLQSGHRAFGYFSILALPAQNTLQISKLYVRKQYRDLGLGKRIMTFIEQICQLENLEQLQLTVNRHNSAAIRFYLHNGFIHTNSQVLDIGNGYVMDDFIMCKSCQP